MVDIQDNMPPDPKRAEAQKDAAVKTSLQKIKHKIMVMSGKGGVGKTSTAVNLSLTLAEAGHRVGIMDVDLHGPDVPRMLGIEDARAHVESKAQPDEVLGESERHVD